MHKFLLKYSTLLPIEEVKTGEKDDFTKFSDNLNDIINKQIKKNE